MMHFVQIVSHKHKQFYYNNAHNEPVGPLTFDQIQKLVELGRIGEHTWIIERNGLQWKKLSEFLPEVSSNQLNHFPQESAPVTEKISQQSSAANETVHIPKPPFVTAQPQPVKKNISPPLVPQISSVTSKPLHNVDKTPTQPSSVPITQKTLPEEIKFISHMNLLSGIVNILTGFLWIGLGAIFSSLNFFLILPPALYGMLTGTSEIIFASKILARQTCSLKQARITSLMSIFSFVCGNFISGLLGLINLMNYNDTKIRTFFETVSEK